MDKTKKIIMILTFSLIITISIFIVTISVNSYRMKSNTISINVSNNVNPDTNFFSQPTNKEKVLEVEDDSELINNGYKLVSSNSRLNLYLDESNIGIAIYDKEAKYIWYSSYKNYKSSGYTAAVKQIIGSGVQITCFDSSTLNEIVKYSTVGDEFKVTYDYLDNGFIAHMNFVKVAISFDLEVTISNDSLKALGKFDTLVEGEYKTAAMKFPKQYKLKSVDVFPYFGSENYEINGYSFIPDGSGALIRFTDVEYNTAYIKRVYGNDNGITPAITNEYLKNENNITLPIYGISHGYNQAAFYTTIDSGYGSCELHSYPYMYSNINLNRTFFTYIARDKINITMASSDSGKITIINDKPYHNEFSYSYHFLKDDEANYVGMAKSYKDSLELTKDVNPGNINLKLDVIAQDYKKGLFGKNYITLTSYKDLANIINELSTSVYASEINYIGYNNNGYFDNTLSKIKLDSSLGSRSDYNNLLDIAKDKNSAIYYYSNPLVATRNSISKKTIKTTNLSVFNYNFKSSLDLTGKIINVDYLADYFLKNQKQFNKLNMNNFTFEYLGNASFSYRYRTSNVSREEMIGKIKAEVEEIVKDNRNISLYKPNNYLLKYISSYYDTDYESSKYSFITDTIPFISILLSGNVNMYSSNINYVSDFSLFNLRLVEYNIYPSYVITNEDTNILRYANYEYLFTTTYSLWKDNMINSYTFINNALKEVKGSNIINHEYIALGVAKVDYSNGKSIIVNYTNNDYIYNSYTVKPLNYSIIGGI